MVQQLGQLLRRSLDWIAIILVVVLLNAEAYAQMATREVLSSNRIYFVRTDGNDANDGLSNTAGGAFLTCQRAVDLIAETIDTSIYGVTIQVAAGTYTDICFGRPLVGSAGVQIVGDLVTPSNVVRRITNSDAFRWPGGPGLYTIRGFKLEALTSGYGGLRASEQARLKFGLIEFGEVGHSHVMATRGAHVFAIDNYSITAGAGNHFYTEMGGIINAGARNISISNTPNFYQAFARATQQSQIVIPANVFTGSATGKRFSVEALSYMGTNQSDPATYLPGDSAGTVTGGGLYD